MKSLEHGQEKINKICTLLRDEAIEPAKKAAEDIIAGAQKRAEQMIAEAQNQAKNLMAEAKSTTEREYNVFQASLEQACKQSLETLRQSIEKKLFNEQLETLLQDQITDPKQIANLITAIVNAMEKEGLSTDLAAVIPKSISPHDVNKHLLQEVINKLKDRSVMVGNFKGGAQVKLVNKHLTIDVTDQYLLELLASYLRMDFRKMLFR